MKRFLAGFLVFTLLAGLSPAVAVEGVAARVLVPAVAPDAPDGGVSTHIRVEALESGEGNVYLSTPPYSEPDFEEAIQVAVEAAAGFTGKSIDGYDFLVSIDAGEDAIVEGPSIGASAAVAAAAALTGREVRPDVAVTGNIRDNGTLGGVGGLVPKAAGAASGGATVLVVPEGERHVTVQNETRIKLGPGELVIEGPEESVDLVAFAEEAYGLRVVEARTLEEAYAVATSPEGYVPPRTEDEAGAPPEEALPPEPRIREVEVAEPGALWVSGAFLGAAIVWRVTRAGSERRR